MELTPRVGDRVVLKKDNRTRVGEVLDISWSNLAKVAIDGEVERCWVDVPALTVVDREPVEWPDGWSKEPNYILGPLACHEATNIAVSKAMLESILATGPDMLARWDELMGEQ